MEGKRVVIQKRDEELFLLLCSLGFLTLEQISKYVFKTSYNRTAARLIKLREKEYIRFIRRRDHAGTWCYIPNMKALRFLYDRDDEMVRAGKMAEKYEPWYRPSTTHEDLVREWALRAYSLFPESIIEMDYFRFGCETFDREEGIRKYPDITFHACDGTPGIEIEIELHPKANDIYVEKFVNNFIKPSRPILYLVKESVIKKKLLLVLHDLISGYDNNDYFKKAPIIIREFSDIKNDEDYLDVLKLAMGPNPLLEKRQTHNQADNCPVL